MLGRIFGRVRVECTFLFGIRKLVLCMLMGGGFRMFRLRIRR